MTENRRAISVVVPMYGDPDSLRRCLESLVLHVDGTIDRVLLVNDIGPEADEIEAIAQSFTRAHPHFTYSRNERNLGFVGACNRVALEIDDSGNDVLLLNSDTKVTSGWLDEMGSVLHSSPDHGVVCARSTNATIASVPFRQRDPNVERTEERAAFIHARFSKTAPRYIYTPVAMGFCFLIRREAIDEHGLFDEVFAPGYGEENDFCLRIASGGYRSVMANRAFVHHDGAKSFESSKRLALRKRHQKILNERYPQYGKLIRDFLWTQVPVEDSLADALWPDGERVRVLYVSKSPSSRSIRKLFTALQDRGTLSVVTTHAAHPSVASSHPEAEVLELGQEENRVWDFAVVDLGTGPAMLIRAFRSAPKVLFAGIGSHSLAHQKRSSIDANGTIPRALRLRWQVVKSSYNVMNRPR